MAASAEARRAPGSALPPGTRLAGRFTVDRVIGMGSSGRVYLAADDKLPDQAWAVKEIELRGSDDPDHVLAEAAMLASLEHPAFPHVVDRFEEHGRLYIVMERIPGEDLQSLMERRPAPLPKDQVVALGLALCDALRYLHERPDPVVLRDLKASNVMLEPDGRARIIDLGVARTVRGTARLHTLRMGSVGYAPPEQYGLATAADPRSDLYALCALLQFLATGRDPSAHPPFSAPEAGRLEAGTSPALAEVIRQGLAYEAERRWPSARALAEALEQAAQAPAGWRPRVARRPTRMPLSAAVLLLLGLAGLSSWGSIAWMRKLAAPPPPLGRPAPPPTPLSPPPGSIPQALWTRLEYPKDAVPAATPHMQANAAVPRDDVPEVDDWTSVPWRWQRAFAGKGATLWLGAEGAVAAWDAHDLQLLRTYDLRRYTLLPVRSIHPLDDGRILFAAGTQVGVLGTDLRMFSLSAPATQAALTEGPDGTVWCFGTVRGQLASLHRWTGQGWEDVDLTPQRALLQRLEDEDGLLWRLTRKGPGPLALDRLPQLPDEPRRMATGPDGTTWLWTVRSGQLWRGTRDGDAAWRWERTPPDRPPAPQGFLGMDSVTAGAGGRVALNLGTRIGQWDGTRWVEIPMPPPPTQGRMTDDMRLLGYDDRGRLWASRDLNPTLFALEHGVWKVLSVGDGAR